MKRLPVYTSAPLLHIATFTSQVNAKDIIMKRNTYTATCNYTAPLHTYEGCYEGSYIGRVAANCAMDQALDDCHADPNSECTEVSVKVWPVSSSEFIGFKKCMARARVHGYQLK